MHQVEYSALPRIDIARYCHTASLPSQQETLGRIVAEILRTGTVLNRKTLCTKLLLCLEAASTPEEEKQCQELLRLLFAQHE